VPGLFMCRWPCSRVHSVCARQSCNTIGMAENGGKSGWGNLETNDENGLGHDLIGQELRGRASVTSVLTPTRLAPQQLNPKPQLNLGFRNTPSQQAASLNPCMCGGKNCARQG
jgi:hypothetical protein